jgi:hypothetical protein
MTVSQELEAIAMMNAGVLQPEMAIQYARDNQDSALHACLVWDDAVASELYRVVQIRRLAEGVRRHGQSAWLDTRSPHQRY